MILISYSTYLLKRTDHINYRPTLSNLFGESKGVQSKLRSVVLILW